MFNIPKVLNDKSYSEFAFKGLKTNYNNESDKHFLPKSVKVILRNSYYIDYYKKP